MTKARLSPLSQPKTGFSCSCLLSSIQWLWSLGWSCGPKIPDAVCISGHPKSTYKGQERNLGDSDFVMQSVPLLGDKCHCCWRVLWESSHVTSTHWKELGKCWISPMSGQHRWSLSPGSWSTVSVSLIFDYSDQWLSTFPMLQPFNTGLHIAVTPRHTIIFVTAS